MGRDGGLCCLGGLFERDRFYDYQIVSTYTTLTIVVVVFFFCLAISFFLLFGHFCMFCIFRYLWVTVYIQLFSFRAASVCLINSVVSCQLELLTKHKQM